MTVEIETYWKTKPVTYTSSDLSWMNWFDKCVSHHDFQKTGMTDFTHRIFSNPCFYDILGDPGSRNALEIGVGAGRLTNISCKIFKHVHGIDIHDDLDRTADLLRRLGNDNFTLHQYRPEIREDIAYQLGENIDFVYSFIVFQHFKNWKTAEDYIQLIDTVLSDKGCGKIFFGLNRINERDFIERELYEEQGITLSVSPKFIERIFSERFDVIEIGSTTKKLWNKNQSDQFFISFKRKSK